VGVLLRTWYVYPFLVVIIMNFATSDHTKILAEFIYVHPECAILTLYIIYFQFFS